MKSYPAAAAVTGDIHAEDEHVKREPLVASVTAAVCVANFFFVTIVLMNLVRRCCHPIVMLSAL